VTVLQTIQQAIQQAKQICIANGQNLTPIREEILSLMIAAQQPLTAYELLDKYRESHKSGAQPPTIYRALNFLEDNGFIHRLNSTRQFVVCDHLGEHDTHTLTQFFICDQCGTIEETLMNHTILHAIQAKAQQLNFAIKQPNLEIHGLCALCQTQS